MQRWSQLAGIPVSMFGALASLASAEERTWLDLTPRAVEESSGNEARPCACVVRDDGSFQTSLPAPRWSEVTAHFRFTKETVLHRLRVEFLPDLRFDDGRLGRNPERMALMLFDVEARRPEADGVLRRIEWGSCRVSADAAEPGNTDGVHLIDAASDTGWRLPKSATEAEHPIVVLTFDEPVTVPAGGEFTLAFDVGGAPEFDTPARYRVSYTGE